MRWTADRWLLVLLALVAVSVTSGHRSASGPFTHYDARLKADSVDASRMYFAKAGSLTANADSMVGYMTYCELRNASNQTATVRIYSDAGPIDAGTDSSYTELHLLATNTGSTLDEWTMPLGLRLRAIRVVTWAAASGIYWRAGR